MTSFLDSVLNLTAGGLAGSTAVYAVQPFLTKKLDAQKGVKSSWHPRKLWAGVSAIAMGDAAVLAIQNAFFETLRATFSFQRETKLEGMKASLAAVGAGWISTIPATVSEITMDKYRQSCIAWDQLQKHQQTMFTKPSYSHTIKKIWRDQGIKGFFLGFKCTAMRETIFTLAWKMWAENCSVQYNQYISNQLVSSIFGGITAGLMGAALSHPFDTAKVKIQNDLKVGYLHVDIKNCLYTRYVSKRQHMGKWKAVHRMTWEIFQESFKGFSQRAGLIAVTVAIVSIATPAYTEAMQKLSQIFKTNKTITKEFDGLH